MRYFIILISVISVNALCLDIKYPKEDMVEFAVEKLKKTLAKNKNYQHVEIRTKKNGDPQSFSIKENEGKIIIEGADSHGMMYGVQELNERLLFRQNIKNIDIEQKPFIAKRGLKFNIPLDARAPSYDDTGDSAQKNIATVWDISFWHEYLDRMALYRYNHLTLWNPQPFTSMLALKKYPGVALDDVHISTQPLTSRVGAWGDAGGVRPHVIQNTKILKKISVDEKIAFWKEVLAHAKRRGIDIHIITWAIYPNGIPKRFGIDDKINNPKTLQFFRDATKELVLTYPDLKGIGVTAGENMPEDGTVKDWSREKWLWNSYGRGILDAKKIEPKRSVSFIHRFWYSGFGEIEKYWDDYPDPIAFSFKYLMARMYSSSAPSHLLMKVMPYLKKKPEIKTWWNLRNDDIYVHRWGDPDYARDLYRNIPHAYTEGIHMGSDGYVWGRAHADKSEAVNGGLELDKHWYNFMLWGRLAYNNTLDRAFFENQLMLQFGGINASLLYDTWASASKIIPLVNQFQFQAGDRRFSPETSSSRETFRYVNDFQVSNTLPNSGVLNVRQYVSAIMNAKPLDKSITPLQQADKLTQAANNSLSHLQWLQKTSNIEALRLTLDDIKAMSHLGLYYAEKIRTAVNLEFFEKDGLKKIYEKKALEHSKKMLAHWESYAHIGAKNYHSQMLARTNNFDWRRLTDEVEYEIEIVKQKIKNRLALPITHDPDNKLSLSYITGLGGEKRHRSLRVSTPDSGEYYLEVYEDTGAHINTLHSFGDGAIRWEWLQMQRNKKLHLNLKWNDLNRVISVGF